MNPTSLVVLLSATTVNAALPGPCVILTGGRSAVSGPAAGARITIGVLLADLVLVAAALSITGGALTVSDQAFRVTKWIGSLLLLALAARMLCSRAADAGPEVCTRRSLSEIGSGFIVGLSSPFNLIFLLALLPQFVPADMGLVAALTMTGTVLCGSAIGQIGAVAVGLCSRGAWGAGTPWLERAAAVSLAGFAFITMLTPVAF